MMKNKQKKIVLDCVSKTFGLQFIKPCQKTAKSTFLLPIKDMSATSVERKSIAQMFRQIR